jgi:hypothetical protein
VPPRQRQRQSLSKEWGESPRGPEQSFKRHSPSKELPKGPRAGCEKGGEAGIGVRAAEGITQSLRRQ